MKPIQLNGLTEEQVEMLDIMWSMDSVIELEEWLELLDPRQLAMAQGLQLLLMHETLEQLLMNDPALEKATCDYLQKFRL